MAVYGLGPVRFSGVSQVTATLGPNDPEIGTTTREGNDEYVLVYNAGNSQASPGQCVTASGTTGYSCTVSTTTMADFAVGVVKHSTLTTGTYGWVLTKGFGPAKMPANSGCAAGQLLTTGGDGVLAVKSISTDCPAPAFAKVVAATGSAGVATAFYKCF